MYLQRELEKDILKSIRNNPVTAVTGPRQCGKSTLVKHILETHPNSIYLDLERPSDLQKLGENAEYFLSTQKDKLICIDEVQRQPELFPLLRSLVDEWNRPGCFLILGSASRDLLKQSSETLAGRIAYKRLTPFLWNEVSDYYTIEKILAQGSFPRSLLAPDNEMSFEWRENFISTFLERDLLLWSGFTPATMRRLWQMLAHHNGQTVNYSMLGNSLGVSSSTVKSYIDLLQGTYMVEVVQPYFSNLGKRLVKAPKVYIADSGITTALIGFRQFEDLPGLPIFGQLWEQVVLTNLKGHFADAELFFYRTANGSEIDFVMKWRNFTFAIECKTSLSPALSKGNYNAFDDIKPNHTFVVIPQTNGYDLKEGISVIRLSNLCARIEFFAQENGL